MTRTFEATRTDVITAATRIVGPDHAADAAQDACIRVWSNPAAVDEISRTLT